MSNEELAKMMEERGAGEPDVGLQAMLLVGAARIREFDRQAKNRLERNVQLLTYEEFLAKTRRETREMIDGGMKPEAQRRDLSGEA